MSKNKTITYLNIDKPEQPYVESQNENSEEVINYEAEYSVIQNTVGNLFSELKNTMNTDTPFFIFNIKRRNEKIRLNNEAQVMMYNQIQNLRAISNELLNLKADDIYGPKLLKFLVEKKLLEAEQYFEEVKAAHKLSITKKEVDTDLTVSLIEHDTINKQSKIKTNESIEADNKIKIAQAAKINAETEKIKSSTKESETKIAIIEKLLNEADFNHLTTQQTFLLHTFLGADPTQFSEFQIREELKDIIKQEKQAEADKKSAEADDFKNTAEYKKWKNDQSKKDFKNGGL
jgi:hypothetical protein